MLKLKLKDSRIIGYALSSEDMVIRLTERNLMLGGYSFLSSIANSSSFLHLENRRNANHHWDLEALKDSSDELEEKPCGNRKKQLQEDLGLWWPYPSPQPLTIVTWTDVKDTQIRDHLRRSKFLKRHVKIWTTLSTNSGSSCSYRRTFFPLSHFCQIMLPLFSHFITHVNLTTRALTQTAQTESASAASQLLHDDSQSEATILRHEELARNIDFGTESPWRQRVEGVAKHVQVCAPSFYLCFEHRTFWYSICI